MIDSAQRELIAFTLSTPLASEHKADKSLVTACDERIDQTLSQIAQNAGLQRVTEEGEHDVTVAKSGNYMTIDPIDGTLGYIEYVNYTMEHGGIQNFLKKDLGATADFCLLLGIVENGIPRYGAVYNYSTKEKILIDGNNKENTIRENNIRNYSQKKAVYLDQRPSDDSLTKELLTLHDVAFITQAALGLKSIYTIVNPHKAAITVHKVQKAGLWDILPAAVAARAFGGNIFDDKGEAVCFTNYITLPGTGATIIKGDIFSFIVKRLRHNA